MLQVLQRSHFIEKKRKSCRWLPPCQSWCGIPSLRSGIPPFYDTFCHIGVRIFAKTVVRTACAHIHKQPEKISPRNAVNLFTSNPPVAGQGLSETVSDDL